MKITFNEVCGYACVVYWESEASGEVLDCGGILVPHIHSKYNYCHDCCLRTACIAYVLCMYYTVHYSHSEYLIAGPSLKRLLSYSWKTRDW